MRKSLLVAALVPVIAAMAADGARAAHFPSGVKYA